MIVGLWLAVSVNVRMVVCCRPRSSRGVYRAGTVAKAQAAQKYDYDLVIVGAGVGGHGAAMHAIESVSHLTSACLMQAVASRWYAAVKYIGRKTLYSACRVSKLLSLKGMTLVVHVSIVAVCPPKHCLPHLAGCEI